MQPNVSGSMFNIKIIVRRPGIEPGSLEWESSMIPLHQRRCLGSRQLRADRCSLGDFEFKGLPFPDNTSALAYPLNQPG